MKEVMVVVLRECTVSEPSPRRLHAGEVLSLPPRSADVLISFGDVRPYIPGPGQNAALAGPLENKTSGGVLAHKDALRLAEEKGVDISLVEGTGKDGRVTKKDVQAY